MGISEVRAKSLRVVGEDRIRGCVNSVVCGGLGSSCRVGNALKGLAGHDEARVAADCATVHARLPSIFEGRNAD